LTFALLFMRASLANKETQLVTAHAQVADLTKANKDAQNVIERFAAQRMDNDAIASLVAAKIKVTNTREVNYQTTIQRIANNDPAVRDWRAVAVPASVRGALQTNRSNPGAP
jgi:hypothetical protein